MSETLSLAIEREFAHPPEKLWRALTEPHLIEEWLMKTDFAAEPGRRFRLSGEWGGALDCEVLAVETNRRLAYTWNFDHHDPALNLRSVVTFTLTPTPTGTRLRVEQAGFRPEQRRAFGGARVGWERKLDKLAEVAARA
jgi:uncharacterized protein YndB with AHSA1/START domain